MAQYGMQGLRLGRFFWWFFTFIAFLMVGLSGCGDVTSSPKGAPAAPNATKTTIYVGNSGDGSLIAFDPSKNAQGNTLTLIPEGNISPTRRFPQSIVEPTGLFLDKKTDTLYVADANGNAILIYENVSTFKPAIGSAAPTRIITGPNTRLDHPFGVTYDATRGQLYVANKRGNSVLRFQDNPIGTIDGNITPSGVLIGGDTQAFLPLIDVDPRIFFPRDIAVDSVRDILYVSNVGNDSILVYDNASTVGGLSTACNPNPAPCDIPPSRIISPHDLTELETILDVPLGIFIDETNDRLYVVNTGFNLPGILIYENASTRNGGVIPERVWMSGNIQLPPGCSPLPNPSPPLLFPPECNNSQLSLPVGIDVDVDNNVMYIANNNNTNNINLSGSGNIDSSAVLVFSLKDGSGNERCKEPKDLNMDPPPKTNICRNISPDRRLGGDVTPDATSLTNPVGIAVDPVRHVMYLSNPTANNFLAFSLDGNINPIKVNSGDRIAFDQTFLEQPAGFFYDSTLDRLFIANFTAGDRPENKQITVFDQISIKSFSNTAPSWSLQDTTNIASPRGISIATTPSPTSEQRLLILSAAATKTGLLIYRVADIVGFPTTATGPTGTITLPAPIKTFTAPMDGLTSGGPTSMTIDEGNGDVYIADKGNNNIIIYDFAALTQTRIITSSSINQPSGLFIDTVKDILYVTNTGDNTVLAFEMASTKNGNITPDRTLSTASLPAGDPDKLAGPIAPYVDTKTDRLFLINSGQDSVFTFHNASSSTLNGEVRPDNNITGSKTRLDFSHPIFPANNTGALHFRGNSETLFVGQPVGTPFDGQPIGTAKDTTCDPVTSIPLECPRGSLLVFGTEGKVAPSRIFSGGDAALSAPAAIALDTQQDILYIADQGDRTSTVGGDDTISIITGASTLDSNVSSASIVKANLSTPLNNPAGLFIDETNNRLYIANSGGTVQLTGTLSVQNDSTVVTGMGTLFLTELSPGDIMNIKDIINNKNESVTVAKIKDNSTLSLVSRWTAPTKLDNGPTDPGPRGFVSRCNMLTPCNILVFNNADQLGQGGPFAPLQIITNPAMERPHGLTVTPSNGRIYVANTGGDSVLVFDSTGLKAELKGTASGISRPVDVAVDPSLDLLYVLNRLEQKILVFEGASNLSGTVDISPARVITGVNSAEVLSIDSDTKLTLKADYTGPTASGMTYGREGIDFSETFVVPFLLGKITVMNGSPIVTGIDTSFTQQLKTGDTLQVGTSLLIEPSTLFLDEANDFLYVTDRIANAVYVFFNASQADGDAVHKTLTGDNTGLRLPSAITVDPN